MNKINKPMIIYFVTKEDEVVYIGQTKQDLKRRWDSHLSAALRGKGSVIGAAIRKHGASAFEVKKHSVYYNQQDLDAAEKMFIKKYRPRYNVSPGGQQGIEWSWNKGKKETRPEVLKRISESAKTRKCRPRGPATPEQIEARAKPRRERLRDKAKAFICHENGKVYKLKIDAAKDLNIDPRGIRLVLLPGSRLKSYKGYTFSYL